MRILLLSTFTLIFSGQSFAKDYEKRLTLKETTLSSLPSLISIANNETGLNFTESDFIVLEDRELATSHFTMFAQAIEGVPVKGKSIRVWKNLSSNTLIQAEMNLDVKSELRSSILIKKYTQAQFNKNALKSNALNKHINQLAIKVVANHPDDNRVFGIESLDQWIGEDLVRTVTIKARRGKHKVDISLLKNKVIGSSYIEFAQADMYQSLSAEVYPIYEEVEATHEMLPRINSELKYIKTYVAANTADPFVILRTQRYAEDMYNPLLAETALGRSQGFWSPSMLKRKALELELGLQTRENNFASGLILDGKYTSINFHPSALDAFPDLSFELKPSSKYYPMWTQGSDQLWEIIPQAGLVGKTISSQEEMLNRPARRIPDHNPQDYINDGFDEIQVYWAVTSLMDSLMHMGFTDPELSTRPFNAFLYDPDIGMKDNAYYTDDTINFTTYSPTSINYARDNSTIWHELGHGIMDRLMGDFVTLADTGGLSEGMADFVAALVVEDVKKGEAFPGSKDFRIMNQTGFFLTNEVHDDGEAYGGTMKDILDLSIQKFGHELGLKKMSDLTMEAMRLTRNNPALTAQSWFSHMLFADELGSSIRSPGELSSEINIALNNRNFSWDNSETADLIVLNEDEVLTNSSLGSRENPIRLTLAHDEKVNYNLKVSLKSVENYKFNYPVTVKVEFQKGALQGAIHWEGEENNPFVYTLNSEADVIDVNLTASGKCDTVNQEGNACKDYAYIQVYNKGFESNKPVAKKRFYLKISQI
jgi:hypothetical protein